MTAAKSSSPSLIKAVITGVVIFGLLGFAVISLNTGDILWFWPVFKNTPVSIQVFCYGKEINVQPGTAAFEAVTNSVNSSLTGSKRWDETTMSDNTYMEYQSSSSVMVLELRYDPPVTVHSPYSFMKSVTRLVIPLVGRHADTNAVFGIEGGFIDPGSYHVNSTAPIATALQAQGVCPKP